MLPTQIVLSTDKTKLIFFDKKCCVFLSTIFIMALCSPFLLQHLLFLLSWHGFYDVIFIRMVSYEGLGEGLGGGLVFTIHQNLAHYSSH